MDTHTKKVISVQLKCPARVVAAAAAAAGVVGPSAGAKLKLKYIKSKIHNIR